MEQRIDACMEKVSMLIESTFHSTDTINREKKIHTRSVHFITIIITFWQQKHIPDDLL